MAGPRFRFLHPRDLAALVGHSGGPHFLVIDGSQKSDRFGVNGRRMRIHQKLCQPARVGRVEHVRKFAAVVHLRQVEQLQVIVFPKGDSAVTVVQQNLRQSHERPFRE